MRCSSVFRMVWTSLGPKRWSARSTGLGQVSLQSFHADATGSLRGASAMPVSLKAHRIMITVANKCAELAHPVDDAAANWRPLELRSEEHTSELQSPVHL